LIPREPRGEYWQLNALHNINDGFQASLFLLLPFVAALAAAVPAAIYMIMRRPVQAS
jgi:hypothetical protein